MTAATRYSRTAMALHWIIALLLAFEIGLGERTEHLERGPELFWVFQLHKSIGITILALSLWRLGTRLRHPRPAALVDSPWAKTLSSAVHWLFYVIMIAGPITGWIIVSTAKVKIPTLLFGIIPLPHLPITSHAVREIAETAHGLMAKIAFLLFFLHIVGALRHQFFVKDNVIVRMAPLKNAGILAVALLIGSVGFAFVAGGKIPAPVDSASVAAPVTNAIAPVESVPSATPAEDAPVEEVDAVTSPDVAVPVPQWSVTGGALNFGVGVSGEQISGAFKRWDANIRFDPARLDQSTIRVMTDLASVSSGDGERDSMLAGSDFFAIASHPQAIFTSNTITARGPDRYRAVGSLTLKGVKKPMTLDFTLTITDDKAKASGTGTLDRRSFNVGEGQFSGTDTISGDVKINFNLNAKRKD